MQRLASVMWRQQRADRLEAEVLAQLEQRHDPSYIGGYVPSSPRAWDAARFSAVQRQQARLDRTFFKLLDELDRLTPAPADEYEERRNEPEAAASPAEAANDDDGAESPNEPNREPAAAPTAPPPAPAPLDFDDPVLPLTPELRDLLERGGEANWKLFCRGRRAQTDAALRTAGLPGLRETNPSRPAMACPQA